MTELSAAVGIEQLRKIDFHVERREALGRRLSEGISGLEGLTPPAIRSGCRHVYYLWAIRFDKAVLGVTRDQFSRALAAEGFPHFNGYVRPLYLLPVFQRRTAFGSRGYPFALSQVPYPKGLCPVCERMHDEELICFETCMYNLSAQDADLFIEAIRKVHGCRDDLSSLGD
jgi:dTDP-4-amino-4,6-dideoxygalactose transaminase